MQWCRRDKVALRTTCIKNVKFKIIKKDRLSVVRILLLQRNLKWAARNLRLGRMRPAGSWLDIADLDHWLTISIIGCGLEWSF